MSGRLVPLYATVALMLLAQDFRHGVRAMENPSSNPDANEVAIVVDCDKAEYFPTLRSKFDPSKLKQLHSVLYE